MMNASTLNVMSLFTAFPLNLTGIIAEGCRIRFNSWIEFFINRICRTSFTPPAVDPAEPPANINRKHFAFENWKGFNEDLWEDLLQEAQEAEEDNEVYDIVFI